MDKLDLPTVETLYITISNWDYFKDLREENVVVDHLEEDKTWESLKVVDETSQEKVPLKFSSSEEYVKIWYDLFLSESKAQITRSKQTEKEESELFSLIFISLDGNKKFGTFELSKLESKGIMYSSGDLIVMHFEPLENEKQEQHLLGIVDKFNLKENFLTFKSVFYQDKRRLAVGEKLTKKSSWHITRLCNLATIVREYQALMGMENYRLAENLLHPESSLMEFTSKVPGAEDYFFIPRRLDSKLRVFFNSSQYQALNNSLKKRGFTLIQGPPGTGKSTTILGILSVILASLLRKETVDRRNSVINMVNQETLYSDLRSKTNKELLQNIKKSYPWVYDTDYTSHFDECDFTIDEIFGFREFPTSKTTDTFKVLQKPEEEDISPPEKILVCAPSNVAIDEIVRKLATSGLLDHEGNGYFPKFVRIGPNFHPDLRQYSLDFMVQEKIGQAATINTNEVDALKFEILSNVKIVCSTLSIAGSNILTALNQKFDTVVIDEAAQAIETSTLIPLKYNCERVVLVGDPKQLAATVFSQTALKYNYDQSMFKRFQEAGHEVTVLRTQYRMHTTISRFISETFYDNLLDDDESIKEAAANEECLRHPCFQPFTFYDIESAEEMDKNSFYNQAQIFIIEELVKKLKEIYKGDVSAVINKCAIISPYSSQVKKLRDHLRMIDGFSKDNCIDVNTVDGFQGKEKDLIIFSTVRSKGGKSVGFLADERRMNVGLSRAKHCLIVVGDSKKLIQDKNWEKLVKYSFRQATFYKIKGSANDYFKNFEENYEKFKVKDEETFVKMVYAASVGR